MLRIVVAALAAIVVSATEHPPFSKQVTNKLEDCDHVVWVPNLKEATFSSVLVTNQSKTICVTAPQRDIHTMAVLSFLPTTCVRYNQELFLQHTIDGVNIYKTQFFREGCVGSRTRRELAKNNATIDMEPFVVAVKRAILIPPNFGLDYNIPYLVFLIFLLATIAFGVVRKLMYNSSWVLFINSEHPDSAKEKRK